MLTTQAIFEGLQGNSNKKPFPTYKQLLTDVQRVWQENVAVLPVEIGPKDLVEQAVSRQWIRQFPGGGIEIVVPKEPEEFGNQPMVTSAYKSSMATSGISGTGKAKVIRRPAQAASYGTIRRFKGNPTRKVQATKSSVKSRAASL